ncbi:hypothetical protein ACVMYR_32755 [Micromonospora sp. PTRAS2]
MAANPDEPDQVTVVVPRARGVQIGDGNVQHNVFVTAGVPVRSAYLQQVRRIAPDRLVDRAAELAELTRFCTRADGGAYLSWQAPAWAGKTALISWFVLNPPPDVRIVSFFVTARFAGQSDRIAFTDVVLEQLAELLERPMPAYLTDATRDVHLLEMLADAAEHCQRRGERLVLVIDGLDEDSGVTAGPDAHSIAAVLPARPAAGMRVIVAGRPDPPLPVNVPDDHPLRDGAAVRILHRSAHAQVLRADAQRELKRLLRGERTERDLLGLLTAAGGGLSGPDLAELTGLEPWEIDASLRAVSGRTFARRLGDAHTDVYLLGHEELQSEAVRFIGEPQLRRYREQLHTWADRVRAQRWPAGTSEYLLRGYFRMLYAIRDEERMLAYATDRARHDRMLDLTGGDVAALTEIGLAQDVLLARVEVDPLAMLRLAMHRDDLTARNVHLPVGLPAVRAALGQAARAEAMVASITSPARQTAATIALVSALADAGDPDRAEALTMSITDASRRAEVAAALVPALARAGYQERADALLDTIDDPGPRVSALIALCRVPYGLRPGWPSQPADSPDWPTAPGDQPSRSFAPVDRRGRPVVPVEPAGPLADLVDRVEALAERVDGRDRAGVLVALADAVPAAAGSLRLTRLADRIESLTVLLGLGAQAAAFTTLVRTTTSAGDRCRASRCADRAELLAGAIAVPHERAAALTALMVAVGEAGDHDRAAALAARVEALTATILAPGHQAAALAGLSAALARIGKFEPATALARTITDPLHRTRAWTDLATYLIRRSSGALKPANRAMRAGMPAAAAVIEAAVAVDEAVAAAREVAGPRECANALAAVAGGMAASGRTELAATLADEAERLARSVGGPAREADAAAVLARAVTETGQHELAETLIRLIADPGQRADSTIALAISLERCGDLDRAEALANSVATPHDRGRALAALVAAQAIDTRHGNEWPGRGFSKRAVRLAARAEEAAHFVGGPEQRAAVLLPLIAAAAEVGDLDRAERLAADIAQPYLHHRAVAVMVVAAFRAGHGDWAERRACVLDDVEGRAAALTALVAAGPDAAGASRLVDLAKRRIQSLASVYQRALALTELLAATGTADAFAQVSYLADRAERSAASVPNDDARDAALAGLALTLIQLHDRHPALGLLERAERIADRITRPDRRTPVLAALAADAAGNGDGERGNTLVRAITDPRARADAIGEMAVALGTAGRPGDAETLLDAIADPDRRARALTALAELTPAARATRLVARALRIGDWTTPLLTLSRLRPDIVTTVASDYATLAVATRTNSAWHERGA